MDHDLATRVGAAADVAAAHRDEAERTGRLSAATVSALVDAGVARLYLPRLIGGLEVDPLSCAVVTERLAEADSAAGWFVMVSNAARLMAQFWPESLVEEVFEHPDVIVAASGNRPFTAKRCAGGVRVSGVNGFVSGCHHARWLLSPVLAEGQTATVLVPMDELEILDGWQVLGMRGTGSNDVRAEDVFVPDTRLVPMQKAPCRNRFYAEGALYRCPSRILFATYVPVLLTLARQALDALDALVRDESAAAQGRRLKDRSLAQLKYGRALATYRAGRGYFQEALHSAWERAQTGTEATSEHKADLYLAGTHAAQSAAQVVRWVADAAGTSVIYEDGPLARIVRDMETLRHHGFVSESRYASVTQVLWGAELDYQLLLR